MGIVFFVLAVPVYSEWKQIDNDSVHDPEAPALSLLQSPSEALSVLPSDKSGNKVNWVEALRQGHISPRTNLFPETKIEVLDLDNYFSDTGSMKVVRFPHLPHTEWLDCSNCHDKIFKKGRGINEFGMFSILKGDFCGQCHGAVAFPLTECGRCHTLTRDEYEKIRQAELTQ